MKHFIFLTAMVLSTATTTTTTTATTATTAPELRERVLVYGLKAEGVDERVVKSIERVIVSTAVAAGYEAISSQDIATILDIEATRQAAVCGGESSCVAELAGGLGAKLVVTGTVEQLDARRYELSLTLLEQNATTVKGRANVDAPSPSALRDAAAETTRKLLGIAVAVVDNSRMTTLWIGGAVAAGVGIAAAVVGVLPLTNALTNAGYARDAADAYADSGAAEDLAKVDTEHRRYGRHAERWNTWGWPVAAVSGALVVGGVAAVVVGATGLE